MGAAMILSGDRSARVKQVEELCEALEITLKSDCDWFSQQLALDATNIAAKFREWQLHKARTDR